MKTTTSAMLLVILLTISCPSYANVMPFDLSLTLTSDTDPNFLATVTGVSRNNHMFKVLVTNRSSNANAITSFAFNLPSHGNGIEMVKMGYPHDSSTGWMLLNIPQDPLNTGTFVNYSPGTIAGTSSSTQFDTGFGIGPSLLSKTSGIGISAGSSQLFALEYLEMRLDSWDTPNPNFNAQDYTAEKLSKSFTQPNGFAAAYVTSNGQDLGVATKVTATPIPAAVWLLGSGVVGLFGLSRKYRKGNQNS